MTYRAEFIDEGRGLVFLGTEIVTVDDILAAKKALNAEQLGRITYAICDLREVHELKLNSDDMHMIARMDKELAKLAPGILVALVSPKAHVYGLSRMWQTLVEDTKWPTAIFLSREEADNWVRTRNL